MTRLALGTTLVMPFAPAVCKRPRVGRYGTYYPPRYTAWKKAVAAWLAGNWSEAPATGLIRVDLVFVAVRPRGGKLPSPRGDLDNFVKSVLDAFNGVVWEDDAQVVELRARKEYGPEAMISAFVQALPESNIT